MNEKRVPMYPRDGANSFALPSTKEGVIKRMVPLGEFMEVFTPEETFKVQTPESVDPGRTNAHAMWVNVKVADVGSASPIVARTLIMAHDMLRNTLVLKDDERIESLLVLMHKIKNSLLQCDQVARDFLVMEGVQAASFTSEENSKHSRAYSNFPVIPDLEAKVTSFLIGARRVITDACQIPSHFWSLGRIHSGLEHLLDKEIAPLLGEEHRMVLWFRGMVPGMSRVVDFRNGQEHGTTTKARRLTVKNFEQLPTNQVHVPVWYLEGEQPVRVADEMPAMVEHLLQFTETMLVACLDANLPDFPPLIMHTVTQPDPLCPVQYELTIDASRLTFPKSENEAPT